MAETFLRFMSPQITIVVPKYSIVCSWNDFCQNADFRSVVFHYRCLCLWFAPSDDPNVDRRVDMAFRKFLLRVEALRRQNFAASVIASQ